MKRSHLILFFIFLMSLLPHILYAGNESTHTVILHQENKQTEHNQHLDREGRRSQSMPLYCTISKNTGISIIGITEEIKSYEIWINDPETILASFSQEYDFIDFLFLQNGQFLIKIETENYYYFGYLTIT